MSRLSKDGGADGVHVTHLTTDYTRCRGEGHHGHTCRRRQQCLRYVQLLRDITDRAPGDGAKHWFGQADFLCAGREIQHPYLIPFQP